VAWAPDAELGKAAVGKKIVMVGAGAVGIEAALEFAQKGLQVDIIEMNDEAAAMRRLQQSSSTAAGEFRRMLTELRVPLHFSTKLKEITEDSVICEDLSTGEEVSYPADSVLLAMGLVSRQSEADQLRHCAPETDVRIIGDVKKVGTIYEAVNEAFQAALHI